MSILIEDTQYGAILYSHKEQRNMKKFSYELYHIPTQKEFNNVVWCQTTKDFLCLINHWNSSSVFKWKYVACH